MANDVLRNPQTKPCSFYASRKERLEYPRQLFFAHSYSRVGYFYRDRRRKRSGVARCGDSKLAIALDCLLRVEYEVQEDLLQLIRARVHVGQCVVKVTNDFDARLPH